LYGLGLASMTELFPLVMLLVGSVLVGIPFFWFLLDAFRGKFRAS